MKGFFRLPSRKDLARSVKITVLIGTLLLIIPRIALLVGFVPPFWLAAGPSMSGPPIVNLEKVTSRNPVTVADERGVFVFWRPGFLGIPTYSMKRLITFQDTRTKQELSAGKKLADDSRCWFAGDNENVSKDSRNPEIGWIPTKQVIAKVIGFPVHQTIASNLYPSSPPPDEGWVKAGRKELEKKAINNPLSFRAELDVFNTPLSSSKYIMKGGLIVRRNIHWTLDFDNYYIIVESPIFPRIKLKVMAYEKGDHYDAVGHSIKIEHFLYFETIEMSIPKDIDPQQLYDEHRIKNVLVRLAPRKRNR